MVRAASAMSLLTFCALDLPVSDRQVLNGEFTFVLTVPPAQGLLPFIAFMFSPFLPVFGLPECFHYLVTTAQKALVFALPSLIRGLFPGARGPSQLFLSLPPSRCSPVSIVLYPSSPGMRFLEMMHLLPSGFKSFLFVFRLQHVWYDVAWWDSVWSNSSWGLQLSPTCGFMVKIDFGKFSISVPSNAGSVLLLSSLLLGLSLYFASSSYSPYSPLLYFPHFFSCVSLWIFELTSLAVHLFFLQLHSTC